MTSATTVSPGMTATEVTVHRQPVVRPDRSVRGYAVSVVVRGPQLSAEEHDALVHNEYATLELGALAGGNAVFLRATTAMLTGAAPLPFAPSGLVLEAPRQFAELPDAADHLRRLRTSGAVLALADYLPGGAQDPLLPLVDFVKVDLGRGDDDAAAAIAHAHQSWVAVIAEHVNSEADVNFCATHGVEMLQGPLFQRDATPTAREFTVGQTQCLELMVLLTADEVDLDRVITVVCSDPEFTMRVLQLVNSSAFALRNRIDSARRAVVMLGPQPLRTLAMASLIGARSHATAGLWFVLTRAGACRLIADGDEVAFTVGLLSAVGSQLQIDPTELIARTGVSDDVGDALLSLSGPYGLVLGAVLAHEENDLVGVEATGFAPLEVARAYLAAVSDALGTATALSGMHA